MNELVKTINGTNSFNLPTRVSTDYFHAEDWRLILVEGGKATYHFDGTKRTVETGSFFLLGPNNRRISTIGKEAFKISVIFFEKKKHFTERSFIDFKNRQQSYRLLREMFYEIHSNKREKFHIDMLNSLLHIFLRDNSMENNGDYRIRQAVQILKQQNGWRLSAEQVSKKVGLSRSHFNSLFRTYTGKSYAAYCQELRMQLSLTLMQEFGFSSKQTAFEIGSSSSQAFSREFKSYFGSSPRNYLS
jgi:AraC-like DNA-binding protein